ncbi:trihelix transcription factor ENAP2 [Cryptomeria japonica]|uniref:trihelix transcription factor ENAP2 n=1 Tax=Cryptomeria japonica TaxID=3369 RepID=UPI0025ABCA28|nr:trihelix transcription factor ENAP2 [Cryptomeria japonica]XP_057831291.1 trihelix transcription factor ENAP2 [Cryptomeria japonica]XP_057831293.1 trihelix transcription factor ENAP2 [Cryptomeria japonica]XP_057831294.1 trihelix transcription factor ENAP2 [Cryptomeria japonica]XP_057831295.1 trihelix transcription factor ENAP2 [Cryptomeria japonica]XP_057831296.1 trihelix transcription factor ENAP2 [Cryptomeria japonica]XP_057831297.1 trihelix transcription factor ENAP2 [Cryptomeria japonic
MGNLDSMEKQQNGNHLLQQQQQQQQNHAQISLQQAQHQQLQQSYTRVGENGVSKTPDRIKRDEWSEGAVGTLLDAYESKWLFRNRAKLKGNDWEDVAKQVSSRSSGAKSMKTQSQCKNKIESMKKRYRAEATSTCNPGSGPSSWPFFARMDGFLRCPALPQSKPGMAFLDTGGQPVLTDLGLQGLPKVEIGDSDLVIKKAQDMRSNLGEFIEGNRDLIVVEAEGQMQDSNQEDGSNTLPNRKESAAVDSDTSTPRSKIANAGEGSGKGHSSKRRKNSTSEVAESIRSFADSILKLEQAKMEMYKDSERLRAETEVRRGEMELKRTEIIAKTQLQIARLLSGKKGKQKLADTNVALKSALAATSSPQPDATARGLQG